jgi:hypothetical protein
VKGNNKELIIIDLSQHGGPVYAGRPKAEKLREKYRLDEIDSLTEQVRIKIPENTYTINSSFFLGLLGKSVRQAGSKEDFLRKFSFEAPDVFKNKINDYIIRALHEAKPLMNK